MLTNEMKESFAILAEDIRSASREWKKEADQSWPSSSPSDKKMRQLASSDARDIRSVAALVQSGKVFEAEDRASELDTAVREAFPNKFWSLVDSFHRLADTLKNKS